MVSWRHNNHQSDRYEYEVKKLRLHESIIILQFTFHIKCVEKEPANPHIWPKHHQTLLRQSQIFVFSSFDWKLADSPALRWWQRNWRRPLCYFYFSLSANPIQYQLLQVFKSLFKKNFKAELTQFPINSDGHLLEHLLLYTPSW